MTSESRPSSPGYNPDQAHGEPTPSDNFYQPLTDIDVTKSKLSLLLSKQTSITDEEIFEVIADCFATIATRTFQEEAADGEEPAPWGVADEAEFHRPGHGTVFMSYWREPWSENAPREEEAWIQYSPSVYYFRRDSSGKVSTYRNDNIGNPYSEECPHKMRSRQRRTILGIVQQGLESPLPQTA